MEKKKQVRNDRRRRKRKTGRSEKREKISAAHKAGKIKQRRYSTSHQLLMYDFSLETNWDNQAQRRITPFKKCNTSKRTVFHVTSIFYSCFSS